MICNYFVIYDKRSQFKHFVYFLRYLLLKGQWSENKKNGKGVYKYGNGDLFSGSWKADTKHGLGTYTFCKTGAILKGAWSEDKAIQNFEMFFPTDGTGSGFTFHGTWSDDNETVSVRFENVLRNFEMSAAV